MVSRDSYHPDPELDALLREIAADPRSSLFKAPRPRSAVSWADYEEPVSGRTVDLTSAERQLIHVHRLELAHLLRSRWLLELQVQPLGHFHLVVGSGDLEEAPSSEQWVAQTEVQTALDAELGHETGSELLRRYPIGVDLPPHDLSLLVATAMRLDPSNHSRVDLAQDLIRRQETRAAHALFGKILGLEAGGAYAPYALDGMAQVENLHGRLDHARELYRRSVALDERRVSAVGGWLFLSVQTGHDNMALAAARLIDAMRDERGAAFHVLAGETLRTRRAGSWLPTSAAGPLVRRLRDSVGENAGSLLDVFL